MYREGKTGARHLLSLTRCYTAELLVYLLSMTYLILLVTCQSPLQSSTIQTATTMNSSMTLISQSGVFEVGFASQMRPNLATPLYTFAIWYAIAEKKIVWVADRTMALSSNKASLTLSPLGDLQVYDNSGEPPKLVWQSNTANMNAAKLTIEDTGNLVLLTATNNVVWQSFDNPTDTLLPNQTFAANTGNAIIAWANDGDWRVGNYSLAWKSNFLVASWQVPYPWEALNPDYWNYTRAYSQAFLTPDGDFRGILPSGASSSIAAAAVLGVPGRLLRLTFDKDGNLRMYSWSGGSTNWTVEWKAVADECLLPGYCGLDSICNASSCACPERFVSVDVTDSRLGCRRVDTAAFCATNAVPDTFVPASFGVAQFVEWWGNDIARLQNLSIASCMQECLFTCDCQAVIAVLPDPSTGNVSDCWHKKALINGFPTAERRSYLRVGAASSPSSSPLPAIGSPPNVQHSPGPLPALTQFSQNISNLKIVLPSALGAAALLLALLAITLNAVRKMRQRLLWKTCQEKWSAAKGSLVRFTYREITLITTNFDLKIGEGGFGTVFKGQIMQSESNSARDVESNPVNDVVTVAVKRLKKELSSHVEKEFMNELEILGVIHHIHLVSLLGYCVDGVHRLLVYEYLKKGSLDRLLFRSEENLGLDRPVLEWRTRFAIAIQTARGLAYLHDDCKQRIIHCDVKPENILLDSSYCAKVADFGLSRIKNRDQATQTRSKSMHIRGTFGYLAPEYQQDMRITNKVDVFSFGMVLLEIISGRRNLRVTPIDAPDFYFPTWAFPKMETETFMEVVDPAITLAIVDPNEVRRALRVAFWCINEKPQMRPSMNEVVQMLQVHTVAIQLPVPRPAYFDALEFKDDDQRDQFQSSSQDSRIISTTSSSTGTGR